MFDLALNECSDKCMKQQKLQHHFTSTEMYDITLVFVVFYTVVDQCYAVIDPYACIYVRTSRNVTWNKRLDLEAPILADIHRLSKKFI